MTRMFAQKQLLSSGKPPLLTALWRQSRKYVGALILLATTAHCAPYIYPLPSASPRPAWVFRGNGLWADNDQRVFSSVGQVSGVRHHDLGHNTAASRARTEMAKLLESYAKELMREHHHLRRAPKETEEARILIEGRFQSLSALMLKDVEIVGYWQDPEDSLFAQAQLNLGPLSTWLDKTHFSAQEKKLFSAQATKVFDLQRHLGQCANPDKDSSTLLDLLIVVEQSARMENVQNLLAHHLEPLLDTLAKGAGLALRVAVIGSHIGDEDEAGALRGAIKILDNDTPDKHQTLSQTLQLGDFHSDKNQALEALRLSLIRPEFARERKDFFRHDAFLAVLVVSNRDDTSPLDTSQYIQALSHFKGSIQDISLASVVVTDSPCAAKESSRHKRYQALKEGLGPSGLHQGLCAGDLSEALRQAAKIFIKNSGKCFPTPPRQPSIELVPDA
jgi:hypothetical protein